MDAEVVSTVQQLSTYLRRHPEACDALEGIARWWLPDGAAAPSQAVVEAALKHMVGFGALQTQRAADGRVRYRRAGADASVDSRLEALAANPRAALASSAGGKVH